MEGSKYFELIFIFVKNCDMNISSSWVTSSILESTQLSNFFFSSISIWPASLRTIILTLQATDSALRVTDIVLLCSFSQCFQLRTNYTYNTEKIFSYLLHCWVSNKTFLLSTSRCFWGIVIEYHKRWRFSGFLYGHKETMNEHLRKVKSPK